MEKGLSRWIWYPGDFEIYQGLKQNLSREERGFNWPAYWQLDDCRKNVRFSRTYDPVEETSFTVYSHSDGYIRVNDVKHRFEERIVCGPGKVDIVIFAGMLTGVPAVYIEGDVIRSDEEWLADDYVSAPVPVGSSPYYTRREQDPSVWEYDTETVVPVSAAERDGGVLYDFGRELTAFLDVRQRENNVRRILYGESEAEALDREWCYYSDTISGAEQTLRKRAFRYVFAENAAAGDVVLRARHEYVSFPVKAYFECEDEEINRIWETCKETFLLCSGIFFLDGVKRDRWIWSGDAYQSYKVNAYLMFDEDSCKRTIWALRGNDPVRQHINTATDYSMLWILSVQEHYERTGDIRFLRQIWPKTKSMMDFLMGQLDENGFFVGREGDWIYIDWADIDKEGAVCAEQMLLAAVYHAMHEIQEALREDVREYQEGNHPAAPPDLGNADWSNKEDYRFRENVHSGSAGAFYRRGDAADTWPEREEALRRNIDAFFWDEEKGAYIDSFASGKRNVTRHANIFAILYGQVSQERAQRILHTVLRNDAIPAITTPYFKFYELEALLKMGEYGPVIDELHSYWGGMLREGAQLIWEAYDPSQSGNEHYAMYGDPFGKSLCHAWGASPIYMIGRYILGIEPTAVAYQTFRVRPNLNVFRSFRGCVPLKGGTVSLTWDGTTLTVVTDRDGGVLEIGAERIPLEKGVEKRICIGTRQTSRERN